MNGIDAGDRRRRRRSAVLAITSTLRRQLAERYRNRLMRRDAHPKHHGLVDAEVTIEAVDAELAHGLFAFPGRYPAKIRFSNSAPVARHDLVPDVRGFALKIYDARGRPLIEDPERRNAHDFILTTGDAFFAKDAVDFVDFPDASESALKTVLYFLVPKPRLRGGLALLRGMRVPGTPLALTYFSQTPYRLGTDACVKYIVRPIRLPTRLRSVLLLSGVRHLLGLLAAVPWLRGRVWGHDVLRRTLREHVRSEGAAFELLVQRWPGQPPPEAIDDATRRWPRRLEQTRVALIEIPAGDLRPDEEAEAIAFNPWRVGHEHRPVGDINRVRLRVYLAIAALRSRSNAARAAAATAEAAGVAVPRFDETPCPPSEKAGERREPTHEGAGISS